jgi:transposase InsO family protein
MEQMARNLVDALDGFLLGKRYLLLDRDPLYTQAFRRILGQAGVKTVRLPAHSPNLNAFAERFVLSIKSECLERLVPLGESHLRLVIAEYIRHYHLERNHQGLANALVDGRAQSAAENGVVACSERLGGLLKFYHREAA